MSERSTLLAGVWLFSIGAVCLVSLGVMAFIGGAIDDAFGPFHEARTRSLERAMLAGVVLIVASAGVFAAVHLWRAALAAMVIAVLGAGASTVNLYTSASLYVWIAGGVLVAAVAVVTSLRPALARTNASATGPSSERPDRVGDT